MLGRPNTTFDLGQKLGTLALLMKNVLPWYKCYSALIIIFASSPYETEVFVNIWQICTLEDSEFLEAPT